MRAVGSLGLWLYSIQVKSQNTVAYKPFKFYSWWPPDSRAPHSEQVLFSCTNDLNLSAPKTLHTPVLVGGGTSKLLKAEWVLPTHTLPCNQQPEGKGWAYGVPSISSCFPSFLF